MKFSFLTAVLLLIPIGLAVAFLYKLVQAFYSVWSDWRLAKEADLLRADAEARRERKRVGNERRLDNGCAHAFGSALGGFPPGVCPKCGLEEEKPAGDCDHVWRGSHDAVPSSYCEKCGKKHQSSAFL